jgi:hypothetical protein
MELPMKKAVLVLMVLFCGSLRAQNPDGRSASLHVSPSVLWGSADYERYAPVFIPQTQVTNSYFTTLRDSGVVQYPSAFGIDVMLKIPTASYLTLSVSYSYTQRFEEINELQHAYYYWSLKGNTHRISVTASIYNLFSVY